MRLDPQTRSFLDGYNAMAPTIDFDKVTASEMRRIFSIPAPRTTSIRGVSTIDRTIPGPSLPIPMRAYMPASKATVPITLFFHGGGFVIGDLDTTDGSVTPWH